MEAVRRFSKRIFNKKERAKAEKAAEEIKKAEKAEKVEKSKPLPPAPKGSTQSGGRQASSQPAKRRKLQKKPPGTSKPQNPWRKMKPIGEYPSVAEYRGAGVTPAKRVAERVATIPASAPRKEPELESAASDSGLESLPVEKGVEYLSKQVTVPSPTPVAETPDETTPAIESAVETTSNTPDYLAVLNALPLPSSEKYDVHRLRTVIKFSIMHAMEHGTRGSTLSLLYFWSKAVNDEFALSLVHNLAKGTESDPQLRLALMSIVNNSETEAIQWYQNYIGATAVELHSGSDSGLSSGKSVEREPGFKVSDIYRDTSGPRMEEQFMSGKSNTAPIKRPKKPCPVNEAAFKRKRQWEVDSNHEASVEAKRTRYKADLQTGFPDVVVSYSSCREERGPPDAIEHPFTLDNDTVIERSRSLPVGGTIHGGSILDIPITKRFPPPPSSYSTAPDIVAEREGRAGSRRQRAKAKRPEGAQRARSLSVDTTISSLSSLSNSAYSVRFNEWAADHQPRQMPNSIEPPENSDDCHECGKGGDLLCCDTCENSYHFTCLKPALDPKNPPQGEWHCPKCSIRNSFSTLIAHSNHFKKTEFQVPQEIKGHFIGVDEGVVFERDYARNLKNQRYYKSAPHLPRLTKPPKQDGPTTYANPMLLRERDNKGDLIKCSRCGFSSGGTRPIITCDYCPCRFHLDCLDPPRAQPPNPKVGWMCPNHVTDNDMIATKEVNGHERTRRIRRTKNMAYIDCDILLPDDPNQSLFDEDWREKRSRFLGGDVVLNFISAVKNDHHERQKEYAASVEKKCLDLTRQITLEYLEKQGVLGASNLTTELPAFFTQNVSGSIRNMIAGAPVSTQDFDAASSLLGLSRSEPEPVAVQTPIVAGAERAGTTNFTNTATATNAANVANASAPASSGAAPKTASRIDKDSALESSHAATSPSLDFTNPSKAASAVSMKSDHPDSDRLPRIPVFNRNKRSRDDQGYGEQPAQKRPHTDSE